MHICKRTSATRFRRSLPCQGATLVEVLVGFAVFTFMMLASIAVMRIGTGGWTVVESKSDINKSLSRFENDILTELKRASLASVGVYTPTDDYHWALWFKTPVNDPNVVDPTTGLLMTGKDLGDAVLPIFDSSGNLVMQRYILYYITRPQDVHNGMPCGSGAPTSAPDVKCPHKVIVKKELYLLSGRTTGSDTLGPQGNATTVSNLKNYINDDGQTLTAIKSVQDNHTGTVHRTQVLAQNILSFEVTRVNLDSAGTATVSSTGPIVLFDVKAFKTLQSANIVEVGLNAAATVTTSTTGGLNMVNVSSSTSSTGEVSYHTNTTIDAKYAPFTVQLDNRVVPQNP